MPELAATLEPPAELEGRALDVWCALAPRLHAAGLLTAVDGLALVRYCRLMPAWEDAMAQVELRPERGAVLVLAKLDDLVRKLEAKFGLSPADRAGIRIDAPQPSDGKARFFAKSA